MKDIKMRLIVLLLAVFCAVLQAHPSASTPNMPAYDNAGRVLTLNNMGWMHPKIDPVTQAFLEQCQSLKNLTVLEIGASYGYASVEALKRGANTWVNDLDNRHLEIFYKDLPEELRANAKLVPGDFPDTLNLPKANFEAILAVRVLHFFPPKKLEASAREIYALLKPNGKVYVVAESPYLNNWATFIPVYEARKKRGEPFPGFIEDVTKYNTVVSKHIPKELHFLDPETLKSVFTKAGFEIEKCSFLNRIDYPETMRLDGRESVGMIARKPG